MAHTFYPENLRTLEALSRYSSPSTPGITLATIFMDQIAVLKHETLKLELSTTVLKTMFDLWETVLSNKYVSCCAYILIGRRCINCIVTVGSASHYS